MDAGRKRNTRHKVLAGLGIVVAALFVLMAIGMGCGDSKKTQQGYVLDEATVKQRSMSVEKEAPKGGYEDKQSEAPPAAGESNTTQGTRTQPEGVPQVQAKTIKTGNLAIEIKKGSFDSTYSRVALIAEGVGGYVSDSNTTSSNGEITSGTITIRVPNTDYAKVMDRIKKLGEKVTSISEQTEDVSEEYVDLESRINNLRAQEAVYLRLMEKAQTIEESISVQRELSVIQQQIEQLLGRKNYLDNHVQLSTIQVSIFESGESVGGGEGWGLWQAIVDAAHGVVNGLNEVIKFLGNAAVYIVIAVALVLIGYLLYRKRRRPKSGGQGEDEAKPETGV